MRSLISLRCLSRSCPRIIVSGLQKGHSHIVKSVTFRKPVVYRAMSVSSYQKPAGQEGNQAESTGANSKSDEASLHAYADHSEVHQVSSEFTKVTKSTSPMLPVRQDDSNESRRFRRNRRRNRLHKAQNESAEADDDMALAVKKPKLEETEDSASFGEEAFSETDYYFENGLRKVYPYAYSYICYCKLRWKGVRILDMMNNEFLAGEEEHHKNQILRGAVKVNGKAVTENYVLRGKNELISNSVHRHELPVTSASIKIVHSDEDLVIIDKPSSIPVHPCGRFRHNSIIFILGKEFGYHNLRTLYRLDRLTSGVLIFGRNMKATNRIMDAIKERNVTKCYLCRVVGEFPEGSIDCEEPLDKVHAKLGTWRVKKNGKPSKTSFERVSFNGQSSVVKCWPHTGRTHQIRVHLQYLGHPIIDDPLYNDTVWGEHMGKGGDFGKSDKQLYQDLLASHEQKHWESCNLPESEEVLTDPNSTCDPERMTIDPNCVWCTKRYRDPKPEQLTMCLHALSYKGPDWEYSTDPPAWAAEDWKPHTDTQTDPDMAAG